MTKLLSISLCTAAFLHAADFTVVLIPDTQYLTESYPATLNAMMTAVVANRTTCVAPFCPLSGEWNIQAVMGLGDVANLASEMATGRAAWDIIKASGLPFVIPPGNHDYDTINLGSRAITIFDAQFGPAYYSGLSWYGGGFPSGSNANMYAQVTIEGYPFVLMGLEILPRCAATGIFATACAGSTATEDAASWAQSILTANSNRQALIATHVYLTPIGGTHRIVDGGQWGPTDMGYGGASNLNGPDLYSTLVQQNNVVGVFCGHIVGSAKHAYISPQVNNAQGKPISEIMSNFQEDSTNSWVTLLKFRPSLGRIEVYNYSPSLGTLNATYPMYQLDWTPPGAGLSWLPSPVGR